MWPFSTIRRLKEQLDEAAGRIAFLERALDREKDSAAYWRGETNRVTQAPPRLRPAPSAEERRATTEDRNRVAARLAVADSDVPLPITHPLHPLNPINPLSPLLMDSDGGSSGSSAACASSSHSSSSSYSGSSDSSGSSSGSDSGSSGGGGCD